MKKSSISTNRHSASFAINTTWNLHIEHLMDLNGICLKGFFFYNQLLSVFKLVGLS